MRQKQKVIAIAVTVLLVLAAGWWATRKTDTEGFVSPTNAQKIEFEEATKCPVEQLKWKNDGTCQPIGPDGCGVNGGTQTQKRETVMDGLGKCGLLWSKVGKYKLRLSDVEPKYAVNKPENQANGTWIVNSSGANDWTKILWNNETYAHTILTRLDMNNENVFRDLQVYMQGTRKVPVYVPGESGDASCYLFMNESRTSWVTLRRMGQPAEDNLGMPKHTALIGMYKGNNQVQSTVPNAVSAFKGTPIVGEVYDLYISSYKGIYKQSKPLCNEPAVVETQKIPCNLPACKRDCEATPNNWSPCSTTCGPGTQTRTWNIVKQPLGTGKACPAPETRPCQPTNLPCDINCVATAKPWSSCSKDCGPGVQTQEWTVTTQPRGKGAACPAAVTRQCNNKACPVNCSVVRSWYTPNNAKCEKDPAKPSGCGNGNGRLLQKRDISPAMNGGTCTLPRDLPPALGGATSTNVLSEVYVPCDLPACPVDCKVGAYGAFGTCTKPNSASCGPGAGLKTRTRTVTQANSSGRKCTAEELKTSETVACDLPACPTNCRVGEWSAWSQCEGKCDKGQQKRTRTVVEGTNGGRMCTPAEKVAVETRECPLQPCVNTDALYEIKRMRPFQYPTFDMYKAGLHQSFPSPA